MNTTLLDQLAATSDAKVRVRYEAQKATGIVNPIVLAALLDVRPQMLYQYIAKGKLPVVEDVTVPVGFNNTQKKVIDLAVAERFAEGYLGRKVAREEKAALRIQAELEGSEA